ncbi:MAG TPA: MFS transporter [Anaeromyxobacter sp.]|nr:MFS transporter [Anaeromyxobacter sp.]
MSALRSAAVLARPRPAAAPAPAEPVPAARAGTTAALFGFALAGFCSFLGFYASMPLLPLLQRVFAVSEAEAALTVSAPTIAVALASPFAGVVARRFGSRRTIVASLLALPIPALLAATAPTVHALVAWRFLQGLAVPGIYAVGMAYLSASWPADTLGRAMSALITGNVIGGFSGRFVSGIAADHLGGWRVAFAALAVITAIAAGIAIRLLPREGAPAAGGAAAPERGRLRDVLGRTPLLATFAVGFMVLFTQVATFTYVTFHLSAPPFGLGTSALSYLFTVYLVGAVVTPFAGRWIDRVGSRRAISAALAAGVGGAALTLAPSLPLVVAGLAVVSTAVFVSQAASITYLRTAAPPHAHSTASGLYVSIYYVGGAAGGVVPAIAWRAGGWGACIALVVAVQLATVAVARGAWRGAERARS